MKHKTPITVSHQRAPGDVVTMTGMIRDLAWLYGDRIDIHVSTRFPEIWEHNPYVKVLPWRSRPEGKPVAIDYNNYLAEYKVQPYHYLSAFHRSFDRQTSIRLPVALPMPDLHLGERERTFRPVSGRYWVVGCGGKPDAPVKAIDDRSLQLAIDAMRTEGVGVVQVGMTDRGHKQYRLEGVLNLLDRTSLRDLFQLVYHADGVICGATLLLNIAAAFQVPCVVIASGREGKHWLAYDRRNRYLPNAHMLQVSQKLLHVQGVIQCADIRGCRKAEIDQRKPNACISIKPNCSLRMVPECISMIRPFHIYGAAMSYYDEEDLPPVSTSGADVTEKRWAMAMERQKEAVPELLESLRGPTKIMPGTIRPKLESSRRVVRPTSKSISTALKSRG